MPRRAEFAHPLSIHYFEFSPNFRRSPETRKPALLLSGQRGTLARLVFPAPQRSAVRDGGKKTSEPDGDAAAHRAPQRAERKATLAVLDAGQRVEQVARVERRLRADGQAEVRQLVGDEDAQARVVDGEPPVERVDGEDGGARRETQDSADGRRIADAGVELSRGGLEEVAVEGCSGVVSPSSESAWPRPRRSRLRL